MSQRFAWVLNLDAELELARGRPGYVPPRKLLAQLAEHGQSSRRLLGPGDVLLQPPAARLEGAAELLGRAWCPTPLAMEQLLAAGITPEPHPDVSVLRRVNHRLFAHELGGGLPGQRYVRSRQELQELLASDRRRWLLKRPLSFAGRGQLRIIGPISEKQWTWIDASLGRDGLLLEPLVEPLTEVSLHGFVWRDGRHELGRTCRQVVGQRGAFQSVRLLEESDLSQAEAGAVQQQGERVARALAGAGYFGPFGIDAYRYQVDGEVGFCELGEINARYTLGFATGFPRPPNQLRL